MLTELTGALRLDTDAGKGELRPLEDRPALATGDSTSSYNNGKYEFGKLVKFIPNSISASH